MRILLDNSVPDPLTAFLSDHTVVKARENDWDRFDDGTLLDLAEEAAFEVIITADKNIEFQQNMQGRSIALVVLGNSQWNVAQRYIRRIILALNSARPGTTRYVDMPKR